LTSLQGFFCALAISDGLKGTEHFIRSPRCIPFHSSETLYDPHVAIGTNHTMLRLRVHSATNSFLSCPETTVSIVSVDHFSDHRHVDGAFLRVQPVDAIKFVGPSHAVRDEVPFVVAYVGDSLSLFESGFVFLQIARQALALFLCLLSVGDVLTSTEHLVGPPR